MDISYRKLRALLSIAENGSVSAAAIELSMTQPALSRLINQFEKRYGVELFHRLGRGGMQLTEAGRMFCRHANEIIRSFDLLENGLETSRGQLVGKVCVAMPDSTGHVLFVPLIKRFREQYPQIELHVMSAYSGDIPHQLNTGNADVGVVTHEQGLSGLNHKLLFNEQLHLVGGKTAFTHDATIKLTEVSSLPLLLPAMGDMRRIIDQAFAQARMVPQVVMEVDSQDALLDLIREGHGYSIMSFAGVYSHVQRGEFNACRIVDPVIERKVSLVVSNKRPQTLLMRVIEDELVKLISSNHEMARWKLA
jgi:LysR family transcriptional regulator, nitrogen assimilation regulatory protein